MNSEFSFDQQNLTLNRGQEALNSSLMNLLIVKASTGTIIMLLRVTTLKAVVSKI